VSKARFATDGLSGMILPAAGCLMLCATVHIKVMQRKIFGMCLVYF